MRTILNVNDLSVNFDTSQGLIKAVDNISFSIKKGECLGIAGESGSGKTQTFFSITGILSDNGTATGIADFNDVDLLKLTEKELSEISDQKTKDEMINEFLNFYGKNIVVKSKLINGVYEL